MKQAASWILSSIVVVIGASTVVWVMFTDRSIDFPEPSAPPEQPPEVYLTRPGIDHGQQRAILVRSQWTEDGELVTNSIAEVPIKRPAELETFGSDTVLLRIVTNSVPFRLKVTHYDQVNSDGHSAGDPLRLIDWQHPGLFRNHDSAVNAQLIKYVPEGDLPGWEIELRIPETSDASYMVLFAHWLPSARSQGGAYSANWTMSAKK